MPSRGAAAVVTTSAAPAELPAVLLSGSMEGGDVDLGRDVLAGVQPPHRGKPMATTERAVKRTYEDYCRTADDERYELLNGELMMVPAPNIKHQSILIRLGRELSRFTAEHGLGEVYVAPVDVVLSDTDVVQPDVLFISRAREHTITDENVRGAPDLVIEILSPSTADRDVGYKHDLYSRHGVLEYWIVDPMAQTVAVHRQRGGRLELAGTFGRRDSLGTTLLEGLQLDLDDIFAS